MLFANICSQIKEGDRKAYVTQWINEWNEKKQQCCPILNRLQVVKSKKKMPEVWQNLWSLQNNMHAE